MVIELHFPDEARNHVRRKNLLRHRWQNIIRQIRASMFVIVPTTHENIVSIQNFKWFDLGDVNTEHDAQTNKFVHFNSPIPNNQYEWCSASGGATARKMKKKKTQWEQKKNIWNESMTPNSLDRKLEWHSNQIKQQQPASFSATFHSFAFGFSFFLFFFSKLHSRSLVVVAVSLNIHEAFHSKLFCYSTRAKNKQNPRQTTDYVRALTLFRGTRCASTARPNIFHANPFDYRVAAYQRFVPIDKNRRENQTLELLHGLTLSPTLTFSSLWKVAARQGTGRGSRNQNSMLTSKSNWKCCRTDVVVGGGSDFNLMMSIVALHRDCDSVTLAASCELSLSRRNYVHAQLPSAHTLWIHIAAVGFQDPTLSMWVFNEQPHPTLIYLIPIQWHCTRRAPSTELVWRLNG